MTLTDTLHALDKEIQLQTVQDFAPKEVEKLPNHVVEHSREMRSSGTQLALQLHKIAKQMQLRAQEIDEMANKLEASAIQTSQDYIDHVRLERLCLETANSYMGIKPTTQE